MGRLVGAFGLQGWVKVKAFTERPAGLGEHPVWWLHAHEGWREARLEGFEVHAKGPVAQARGLRRPRCRGAAARLRGGRRARGAGRAAGGQIFWVDLVGLEVVDGDGVHLGLVEGLFETGETSVMVVRPAAGGRERMIPFVPDYVKAVDRALGRVTVDWKADYDA